MKVTPAWQFSGYGMLISALLKLAAYFKNYRSSMLSLLLLSTSLPGLVLLGLDFRLADYLLKQLKQLGQLQQLQI